MAKTDWALRTEAAAVAAARENAPYLECIPGSYERDHLSWDEYAASSAADALDEEITDELQKFDSLGEDYGFEFEKREKALRNLVREEFFDPYVRELRKLRPDLRECGDDGDEGEEDGMRGLSAAHGSPLWRVLNSVRGPDAGVDPTWWRAEYGARSVDVLDLTPSEVGEALRAAGARVPADETSARNALLKLLKLPPVQARPRVPWSSLSREDQEEAINETVATYAEAGRRISRARARALLAREGSHAVPPRHDAGLYGGQNAREDEDSLVTGMAWWMWASQYASAWEEAHDAGEAPRPPWSGGGDIADYTPDVPDEILEGARKILRAALERAGIDAEQVMDVALREDEDYLFRGDRGQQAHEFGEWLGGSWLGAGNAGSYQAIQALKDEYGFDIGDGELALFLVDGDPETVEINYFAGTGLSARGR